MSDEDEKPDVVRPVIKVIPHIDEPSAEMEGEENKEKRPLVQFFPPF